MLPIQTVTRQAYHLGIVHVLTLLEKDPVPKGLLYDIVRDFASGARSLLETVARAAAYWQAQNEAAILQISERALLACRGEDQSAARERILALTAAPPSSTSALALLTALLADPDPAVRATFTNDPRFHQDVTEIADRWQHVPGLASAPHLPPASTVNVSPGPGTATDIDRPLSGQDAGASSQKPTAPALHGRDRWGDGDRVCIMRVKAEHASTIFFSRHGYPSRRALIQTLTMFPRHAYRALEENLVGFHYLEPRGPSRGDCPVGSIFAMLYVRPEGERNLLNRAFAPVFIDGSR